MNKEIKESHLLIFFLQFMPLKMREFVEFVDVSCERDPCNYVFGTYINYHSV